MSPDDGAPTVVPSPPPRLVVGLGNPGAAYAVTRHNVGQLVVEELAKRLGSSWRRHRTGRADTAEGRLGPPGTPDAASPVVLMKARCFMNESGGPVAAVASYLSIEPSEVVAVHDELDLAFGTLRVKQGGGDNGHNGLRSMRRALGSGDFARVRVGIGRPVGRQDPADFVLAGWSAAERRELDLVVDRAADAVQSLTLRGLACTQNDFNA